MPLKLDSIPFCLRLSKLITIPFFILMGVLDVRPFRFYETSFVVAVKLLPFCDSSSSVARLNDLLMLMW